MPILPWEKKFAAKCNLRVNGLSIQREDLTKCLYSFSLMLKPVSVVWFVCTGNADCSVLVFDVVPILHEG